MHALWVIVLELVAELVGGGRLVRHLVDSTAWQALSPMRDRTLPSGVSFVPAARVHELAVWDCRRRAWSTCTLRRWFVVVEYRPSLFVTRASLRKQSTSSCLLAFYGCGLCSITYCYAVSAWLQLLRLVASAWLRHFDCRTCVLSHLYNNQQTCCPNNHNS